MCSFKRNIHGMKCWLEDLEPEEGWSWPKWSLLPKGCQWELKGRQANTHKQNRVLQFMRTRCPGMSTQDTWRTEEKRKILDSRKHLENFKARSFLSQTTASDKQHPRSWHLPSAQGLPSGVSFCKALEPLFCITKIQVLLPEWLKPPMWDKQQLLPFPY